MRISYEKLAGKKPVNIGELRFLCRNHEDYDLTGLDVSNITDMSRLFQDQHSFNQKIGKWNLSKVTDTSSMFSDAYAFNRCIALWDVSNVKNMSFMFAGAHAFNQYHGGWNVARVTDMRFMFYYAKSFDMCVKYWDVSSVRLMTNMFNGAKVFNQDIHNWDVHNVENMSFMFLFADDFNTDFVRDWDYHSLLYSVDMFNRDGDINQTAAKEGGIAMALKKIGDSFEDPFFNGAMILTYFLLAIVFASMMRLVAGNCGKDYQIDRFVPINLFCEVDDKDRKAGGTP